MSKLARLLVRVEGISGLLPVIVLWRQFPVLVSIAAPVALLFLLTLLGGVLFCV